jgi:hypothetical protein
MDEAGAKVAEAVEQHDGLEERLAIEKDQQHQKLEGRLEKKKHHHHHHHKHEAKDAAPQEGVELAVFNAGAATEADLDDVAVDVKNEQGAAFEGASGLEGGGAPCMHGETEAEKTAEEIDLELKEGAYVWWVCVHLVAWGVGGGVKMGWGEDAVGWGGVRGERC